MFQRDGIESRIKAYKAFNDISRSRFPETVGINLLQRKPSVGLLLAKGEKPDRYAEGFETRIRLLGMQPEHIDTPGQHELTVDISDRLSRKPNRVAGAMEIPQAVVWLGMDSFAGTRANTILATLHQYDKLMSAADKLDDAASKATARAIICDQLSGLPLEIFSVARPFSEQYFGTGLVEFSKKDVVIDAGAATGASLRKFLAGRPPCSEWHAFEADSSLWQALDATIVELAPGWGKAVHAALAKRPGSVSLIGDAGSGSIRTVDGGIIPAVSIDSYLNGKAVSVIKINAQGQETAILAGAEKTIKKHKPALLVAVHHEISHMHEAPELIRSIKGGYKFGLRNHTWATAQDSWPGAFFCETVLYAH